MYGKVNSKKIEKIQERTLHFIFNDQKGSYISLLENCGYTTLRIGHIKTIAVEVFRSMKNLNPTFMNQMLEAKTRSYDLCPQEHLRLSKHPFTNKCEFKSLKPILS